MSFLRYPFYKGKLKNNLPMRLHTLTISLALNETTKSAGNLDYCKIIVK